MAVAKYVLDEKQAKHNCFNKILVECYNEDDLHNVYNFCVQKGCKLIFIKHKAEDDECILNDNCEEIKKKEHYHCFITNKKRFKICSLLSDTLKYYNFMSTNFNNLEFCTYVLHVDYLDKIQYEFEEINFLNISISSQQNYCDSISKKKIELNRSDDEDTFTKAELHKLMFEHQFNSFEDIFNYCYKNAKLREYFLHHVKDLKNAWLIVEGLNLKPP